MQIHFFLNIEVYGIRYMEINVQYIIGLDAKIRIIVIAITLGIFIYNIHVGILRSRPSMQLARWIKTRHNHRNCHKRETKN